MKYNGKEVLKVYSGRVGCMCGCLGKYSYSSEVSLEVATKKRGYEVEPEEVNDRMVTRVINMFNKLDPMQIDDFGNGVYCEKDGSDRCYAIYFLE